MLHPKLKLAEETYTPSHTPYGRGRKTLASKLVPHPAGPAELPSVLAVFNLNPNTKGTRK